MKEKNIVKLISIIFTNIVSIILMFVFKQFTVVTNTEEIEISIYEMFKDLKNSYYFICFLSVLAVAFAALALAMFIFNKIKIGSVFSSAITFCEIIILFSIIFGISVNNGEASVFINRNTFFPLLLSFFNCLLPLICFEMKKN